MTIAQINNETLLPGFSDIAVYRFIIIAIILFAAFRITGNVLPLLLKKKLFLKYFTRYFPVFELIVWIVFLIQAFGVFIKSNLLFAVGASLMLMFISYWLTVYFLKDIIAGIIFRTTNDFTVNETGEFETHSGRIREFHLRNLEVETDKDESIYIPYSKIINHVTVKSHPAETLTSYSFIINISGENAKTGFPGKVKQEILNLPWTSVSKEPKIRRIDKNKSGCVYEIIVYSPEKEHYYKIENYIKELYG